MENIFTAIIPAYGSINIVKNSVISLVSQWIPDNSFKLEVILVDDNPKMDYSYFLSEEFGILYDKSKVSLSILKNKDNYGQGVSRNIGIENAQSNWILFCDEDDIYAPNALYRFWEVLNEQHYGGDEPKAVGLIAAPIYSFAPNKYREIISGRNIWPNAKLYSKEFLNYYMIRFPDGDNSHRSEDYPFVSMVNYALDNTSLFKRIDFTEEADTFYYWMPNTGSRSRVHPYYRSLITSNTLYSSILIYEYMNNFNHRFNIEEQNDEYIKLWILRVCTHIYLGHFMYLFDLNKGWATYGDFTEEIWNSYNKYLTKLRKSLSKYWSEYTPGTILHYLNESMDLNKGRNEYIEPWLNSFESWVTEGFITDKMSYSEIKDYVKKLEFNELRQEVNSKYVKSWNKRHKI